MSWIDWLVLSGTLLFIVIYGTIKSRKNKDIDDYLKNDSNLKWWQIGISVMATQASAVTFISTPGQAFDEGMGFLQFYFGLPIAMLLVIWIFIPIYHRLKVVTAYEYLESRFNVNVRQLTAFLFLLQRSLAAGITIYAPSIIISTVFGWNLMFTNLIIGSLVIIYTVSGGSKAVSITQQYQMAVMMIGMFVALGIVIWKTSEFISIPQSIQLLKDNGKLEFINTQFDPGKKYNIWSGLLGGTFLALSYFGTDQSQVSRYVGGKTLQQIKWGLGFNAIFKIPMQFIILFTGAMLFVFYMYVKPPVLFNTTELTNLRNSADSSQFNTLEKKFDSTYTLYSQAVIQHQPALQIQTYKGELKEIKNQVQILEKNNHPKAITKEGDFVFIHFILHYMPIGLVGLLFAVILSAAMSSTSSELNALSAATVIDFLKRSFVPHQSEQYYVTLSKWTTAAWGVMAIGFAMLFPLFDNLIEAVNMIGSIFYGVILGIFTTGFFIKRVGGKPLLLASIMIECGIISLYFLNYYHFISLEYLWLNPIGCLGVMILSTLLSYLFPANSK